MKGLPPGPLPEGDRVLWQGRPAWLPFVNQVMHVRWVAAYVALLVAWCIVAGATSGGTEAALGAALRFGGMAAVAIGMFVAMGWGLSRSTTYTITTSHLVIEYGMALPKTVTIPFARIVNADFHQHQDGTADIPLTLGDGRGVPYLLMWPHVRPWQFRRAEPMLRAVPQGEKVAQIMARALAASADMAPIAVNRTQDRPVADTTAAAAA